MVFASASCCSPSASVSRSHCTRRPHVDRATGMKVRRYYVGFRPDAVVDIGQSGETEYGLKAVPAGGFCDIAGMTAIDELAPDEVERYAMYRQKTWKRVAVMFAGLAMNFILGMVLVYAMVVGWGLPNLHPPPPPWSARPVRRTRSTEGKLRASDRHPALPPAGIRDGDVVVAVGELECRTSPRSSPRCAGADRPEAVRLQRTGRIPVTEFTTSVDVTPTQRSRPRRRAPRPSPTRRRRRRQRRHDPPRPGTTR